MQIDTPDYYVGAGSGIRLGISEIVPFLKY
jgi:hypothetical protein